MQRPNPTLGRTMRSSKQPRHSFVLRVMVPLRCAQTFSFAEEKRITINGTEHSLQSANPCIFRSRRGHMLNTQWTNSGDGQSSKSARPTVFANSLVQLDGHLIPFHSQTTYDENWIAQKHQSVMGLRDLRFVYYAETVFFLATKSVGRKTPQVLGTCSNINTGYLANHRVLHPPPHREPENDWVFFPRAMELSVIHSWHPLSICSIHARTSKLIPTHITDTPAIFETFRGSTSAFRLDGQHAFIVHTKDTTGKLICLHRIVILSEDATPLRYSEPFKFGTKNIERCSGAIRKGADVIFSGSIQDAVCCIWIIEESTLLTQLRWCKL